MSLVYRIIHTGFRLFFRLYGRREVIGLENVPMNGQVVIAPNHVSYLDPPLVGSAIPRECRFMARHDLWDKPIMRWLMPRMGAFPVHRGRMDRQAIRSGLTALEQGFALVIFPEGARSDDGLLKSGELGAALFVQKSGAPVVPVAVIGAYEMLPPKAKRLNRVRLKCVFGKPICFDNGATREDIIDEVMRAISDLLAEHRTSSYTE